MLRTSLLTLSHTILDNPTIIGPYAGYINPKGLMTIPQCGLIQLSTIAHNISYIELYMSCTTLCLLRIWNELKTFVDG